MRSSKIAMTIFAVVTLAVGLWAVLTQTRAADADAAPEPWPAFTMIYREDADGLGINGARGYQRIRVEYTNRRSFKATVLEHSAAPEVVGSTVVYDGQTSTHYNANLNQTHVTRVAPNENLVVGPWLVPGVEPALARRPGASAPRPVGEGRLAIGREWSEGGQRFREEVTYRASDGIPTLFIESVDAKETRRIQVEDFRIGAR